MPANPYSPDYVKSDSPSSNRKSIDERELIRRYLAGTSENIVAREFGVSRMTVRRRLVENGIPIRGRSAAEELKRASMNTERRAAQVEPAHAAARLRRYTDQELRAAAVRRQHFPRPPSVHEFAFWYAIRATEMPAWSIEREVAADRYNIDFTVGTVAVELLGGGWHHVARRKSTVEKHLRYLLDTGWPLEVVLVGKRRDWAAVAQDVVAYTKRVRTDPSLIGGSYRVIRGDGQLVAEGVDQDQCLAAIWPRGRSENVGAGDIG